MEVPLEEHFVGGHSISAFEEDFASVTYEDDWIEQFGSQEIKKKLKEYSSLLEYMRGGVQFPVLKLSWYDGVGKREVIIKGFPTDTESEDVKNFIRNFVELVNMVRRVEEEAMEV